MEEKSGLGACLHQYFIVHPAITKFQPEGINQKSRVASNVSARTSNGSMKTYVVLMPRPTLQADIRIVMMAC